MDRHQHEDEDDVAAWRGEPEAVDVYAQQGELDWSREPFSDDLLTAKAHRRVVMPPAAPQLHPR